MARSLAPRGRLALLAWRELPRNEWLVEIRAALAHGRDLPLPPPDAPTPFSLADPDRVRALLNGSGYDDIDFEAVDEPIEFGATVEDAFGFMRTLGIVRGLAHDLNQLVKALQRQRECGGHVVLHAPSDQTLRVLDLVGLTKRFTIT